MSEVNSHFPDEKDRLILAALRDAAAPLSGEDLARRLGISRVALWKRIESLKGLSYGIDASRQGYRLSGDDAVGSWEFPPEVPVRYRPSTASTMDEAWAEAEAGAASGTLVLSDRQSAGRGRLDQAWDSPAGGLYLTLVLRGQLPVSHAGCLCLEAACGLAEYVEAACGLRLDLAWPNALSLDGAKVGGILVEAAGSPDAPRFYTVGLGLRPDALRGRRPPARRELALAFRARLLDWMADPRSDAERWAARCPLVGRAVTLRSRRGGDTHGVVLGFDRLGAIVVQETGSGFEKTFLSGETDWIAEQS